MEILAKFGEVQTFFFPLIDFGATDFEATPVTFATGDTRIIKDGGASANATNDPAHEGNGIYSWTCTVAESQATRIAVTIVDATATKLWEDQALIIHTGLGGQLVANEGIMVMAVDTGTFTATTTICEATMISPTVTEETVSSIFVGRLVAFVDGSGFGELTDITASSLTNSKVRLTYTAIISTPANGDRVVVF